MKIIRPALILTVMFLVMFVQEFAHSATTLSGIRTKVRAQLYETSSSNTLYTDTQINDAIEYSQRFLLDILAISANFNMLKTGTIAVSVGVDYVSLPTDFRRVVSVKYAGIPAIQVPPEDYFTKTAQATITDDPMFFIKGTKMHLYPTPTALTQTVELLYQIQPGVLTADTHTVSLLSDYDHLLVLTATNNILQADNQANRAANVEKLLTSYIGVINAKFSNTNVIEKVVSGK